MLFQTFEYALFFLVTAVLILSTKGRLQKIILLIASMFFYAFGSLAHTPLFIAVILFTYAFAILIQKHHNRLLFAIGIALSFVPLFVYKYLPFLFREFVSDPPSWIIKQVLPIGISFYTFQAVGYLIDVWRGKQKAERDLITYALFVSFFPQLIAGPIERSGNLLQQLKKDVRYNYDNVTSGLRIMAYGLFLKLFVADRIADFVDRIYTTPTAYSGFILIIATLLFGIQIYCDFCGYSTIARGSARVLGIELMENFKRPYFAVSCTDFWRRWHISLSTWFKDYVYIPLGGNRCSKLRNGFNLFCTFLVSGIWHGANWTFAIWGALNGIYQIIEKVFKVNTKTKLINDPTKTGKFVRILRWLVTYCLINLAWLFFRANSLNDSVVILKKILYVPYDMLRVLAGRLSLGSFFMPGAIPLYTFALIFVGVAVLFAVSYYREKGKSPESLIKRQKPIVRYLIYSAILILTLSFGKFGGESQFIYFRF